MSNKKLREGPGPVELKAPEPPKIVTLHDALFHMLVLCRSIHARWDNYTIEQDLLPQDLGAKEPMLRATEAFLTSLTAFDYCTTTLFAGLVSIAIDHDTPRSETEIGIYARWREQFRVWRRCTEVFIKTLQISPVMFRTHWDKVWPPPAMSERSDDKTWPPALPSEAKGQTLRDPTAVQVQNDLTTRILMLRDSLAGMDKLLMQKAPSLLLDIAKGNHAGIITE
jgi:hypothetical protein